MEFYIFTEFLFSHLDLPLFLHPSGSIWIPLQQPLPSIPLASSVTRNFSHKRPMVWVGSQQNLWHDFGCIRKPNSMVFGKEEKTPCSISCWYGKNRFFLANQVVSLYNHCCLCFTCIPREEATSFWETLWSKPYFELAKACKKHEFPTGYLLLKGGHCLGKSVEICPDLSYTTDALRGWR